jgi:hypothetical protein
MELGIEKIEAIKAGTEVVVSFVPIVSTGVSIALLFDDSLSLGDKAWELMGVIPIPALKNLKYVGKIENVVELVGGVVRKVEINSTVARVL